MTAPTIRRNERNKGNIRLTLRLPPELKDALAKEACALRIALNAHIKNLLETRPIDKGDQS